MNHSIFNYWFALAKAPNWIELLRTIARAILIGLLIYAFVTFMWELWYYQLIYMPTMWARATLEQQTQINILLNYMDIRIIITTIALLWVTKR